jgi:hypothetical protein
MEAAAMTDRLPVHGDSPLFDAYVVDLLKRWGRFIGGPSGPSLGYPSKSTIYTAMQFRGPGPRSNGKPSATDIDPEVWLVETIVSQMASADIVRATVLRAAFRGRGTWRDRMETATAFLERFRGMPERMSRSRYYALRDDGIREVRYQLLLDAAG